MSNEYSSFELWISKGESIGFEPSVLFLKSPSPFRVMLKWSRQAGVFSGEIKINGEGKNYTSALKDALSKFPTLEETKHLIGMNDEYVQDN